MKNVSPFVHILACSILASEIQAIECNTGATVSVLIRGKLPTVTFTFPDDDAAAKAYGTAMDEWHKWLMTEDFPTPSLK